MYCIRQFFLFILKLGYLNGTLHFEALISLYLDINGAIFGYLIRSHSYYLCVFIFWNAIQSASLLLWNFESRLILINFDNCFFIVISLLNISFHNILIFLVLIFIILILLSLHLWLIIRKLLLRASIIKILLSFLIRTHILSILKLISITHLIYFLNIIFIKL